MMMEEDDHHAGHVAIHIEAEGDYGFALPHDVEFHILMEEGGHDDHDDHDDHDHGDEKKEEGAAADTPLASGHVWSRSVPSDRLALLFGLFSAPSFCTLARRGLPGCVGTRGLMDLLVHACSLFVVSKPGFRFSESRRFRLFGTSQEDYQMVREGTPRNFAV